MYGLETEQWTALSDLQLESCFQRDHNKYLKILQDQQTKHNIQLKRQLEKEEVILMVLFLFSAVYLVPLFSFLFVITLLKAIEKIVNKRRYGTEMFWSAAFFSLVMWSISVSSSLN
jgi:hypothetical protein